MKRRELGLLLLFLLIFGILGYFREFLFVNLNVIMYMKYYASSPALQVPDIMHFFTRYSYTQLYYGKYVFTLLWTAIFFAANYLALKKLTHERIFLRILLYAYAIMLLFSAVSMMYGYLVKERLASDEYTLSRWLMGIAQSPIICLILLASEKLYKTSRAQ